MQPGALYRALSARALDLSLGQPDVMHAAEELCREFVYPWRNPVVKPKRCICYLATSPPRMWRYDFNDAGKHLDVLPGHGFRRVHAHSPIDVRRSSARRRSRAQVLAQDHERRRTEQCGSGSRAGTHLPVGGKGGRFAASLQRLRA